MRTFKARRTGEQPGFYLKAADSTMAKRLATMLLQDGLKDDQRILLEELEQDAYGLHPIRAWRREGSEWKPKAVL